MKRFLFLGAILIGQSLLAQSYWSKFQGGANIDETLAVTGDTDGNTYTTGYFSSTALVNGNSLSVSGLSDVFLSKVNTAGVTQWSVAMGGAQSDRGLGVAVDPSGNVLVSGFYTGTINFGGAVTLSAVGSSQDAFVAKYGSNGVVIWARSGGSSGNSDRANSVTTDANGNVFITGQFTGEASFGALTLSGTGATNDIFIVKYSPDGTELWARKGSGNALNRGLDIATDNQGAVYTTGHFSGNIAFDNMYTNTILNALFLVKYSAAGVEEWFRYAGGSSQSIGYGLASDGDNVYLTGDCGESLTFFSGIGTNVINSPFDNAVFVAAYDQAGTYLWGQSQGSDSPVSARGIAYHDGELGITGWFECTFQSLSDAYGESNFMNIGFRDIYVMRYNTAGAFQWARNFGSITEEVASGIHILPDNLEVICGTFSNQIVLPIRNSLNASGLIPVQQSPNPGLTYCGDANYGQFSTMSGSGGQDGFLIKAIDLERQPYDFFHREAGGNCDLSIPESCIIYPGDVFTAECQTSLIGCAPYSVSATNFGNFGSNGVGYTLSGTWSPSGTGINYLVTAPADVSVVLQSTDGCYQSSAAASVDIHPAPLEPLMSDNDVVNTLANNTFPVYICPGDSVQIWSDFPTEYDFSWTGEHITTDMAFLDTIIASQPGSYQIVVENEFGCGASNFILVLEYNVPPDTLVPYLNFDAPTDTIAICEGDGFNIFALDSLTMEGIPNEDISFMWFISPDGVIGGSATGGGSVTEPGWYNITLEIEIVANECSDNPQFYTLSDSVYVSISPLPSVYFNFTGPAATCPGDSLMLYVDTNGEMEYLFDVIQDFGDSVLVSGTGVYQAVASVSNSFGCDVFSLQELEINLVETPVITADPESAIVCPGDSILLSTNSPGNITWQGPGGNVGTGDEIYVDEAGLYFAEANFYPGCGLVTNTIQLVEYATPSISSNNAVLCPGETITISVVSTAAGGIEWQAPLTGNGPDQEINEPGIYTAIVSGCGISTEVSIEVTLSDFLLEIALADETPVCEGDSLLVIATAGLENYQWLPNLTGEDSVYVSTAGLIQAQAADTNGCPLVSDFLMISFQDIPPAPEFDFVPVCEGDAITVNIPDDFLVSWTSGPTGDVVYTGPSVLIDPLLNDTTLYAYLGSEYCSGPLGSVTISPKPFPEEPVLNTNAPICLGTSLALQVINPSPQTVYTWTAPNGIIFTGASINYGVNSINQEGTYYVSAVREGCGLDSVGVDVSLFVPRKVSLPPDTAFCMGAPYILHADTIFQTYIWQDGSGEPTFTPIFTGEYFLSVTDFNGCSSSAITQVQVVDCRVIIPNIFTPNGDGRNDSWFIFTELAGYFRVDVYNRWGQKVYASLRSSEFWEGIHYETGEDCSEGVYYYVIDIVNFEEERFRETGTVTLLRK